jgi:hypothetical protein
VRFPRSTLLLDLWFEQEVKPRLRGRATLIRYADDCAPRRRGSLKEIGMETPKRARRRKPDTAKADLKPLRRAA